jgi:eukaryotic-like serine/threonine-protein kinase
MPETTDPQLTETRVSPAQPPARLLPETHLSAGATDRSFDESLRALLHRRLRFCALVGTAGALVLIIQSVATGGRGAPGAALGLIANVAFFAVGATGLILLRGRPSLPQLRVIEVALFASMSLSCGVLRFVGNLALDTDSPDPRHAPVVAEYATALANLPVYFLIFFYGLLIPTTLRRGVAVVLLMGAVPILSLVASGIANPALRPHLPVLLAVTAVGVAMSSAGAIFGLSRIHTLQRQAFEAERRADELGHYTLKKKLGAGGMGEVWLAEHRLLKRPCAVKFVRADLAANPATAARFEREVRAVTQLTHFNTVRIYDYGRADDGSFYYVMEYLEGPTLEALVRRVGPLKPGRAVYLLRQLCGALAEAHAAGLVHRDLKPGNIIVAALGGQHDVAKLLDFGLVQDLSTPDGERLTQAGVVMGTPAYMCPEQAAGSNAVDARGDIYSLGAVAFFMLTGRSPFVCATVGEYLTAHLTQPAPAASAINPAVPSDLAAVVAKCLAKDPKARYQTAAELDAALVACDCAGDWSGAEAERWWAAEPTALFLEPEPKPK